MYFGFILPRHTQKVGCRPRIVITKYSLNINTSFLNASNNKDSVQIYHVSWLKIALSYDFLFDKNDMHFSKSKIFDLHLSIEHQHDD